jgi:hypothetical protein
LQQTCIIISVNKAAAPIKSTRESHHKKRINPGDAQNTLSEAATVTSSHIAHIKDSLIIQRAYLETENSQTEK